MVCAPKSPSPLSVHLYCFLVGCCLHPSLAPFSNALGIELWRNVQFCKIQLSLQGRGKKEIIGAIQSSTRAVWRRYRPRSVFWLGNLNNMCANDLNSESCLGILLNIHEYPVSICSMLILLDLQESILGKDRWPVRQPKRRLVLFWNPPNPWHQGVSMVWIGVLRFGIFSNFFPTKHKMENKFSKLSGMSRHFKGPTKCRRLLSVKQASIIRLDMIGLKSGVSPIERSPFSHDRPGSCGLQPLTLLLCQEPSQGWPRHVAGVHSPARKTLWLWPSLSLKFQHQGRYEHP